MPSPREEKIRESYHQTVAKALSGNLGLRMALMLANPKAYQQNLADLSEVLAADALKALRTRSPFLPEVLAELKEEEAMRKETR
jgi:hypothetical protein